MRARASIILLFAAPWAQYPFVCSNIICGGNPRAHTNTSLLCFVCRDKGRAENEKFAHAHLILYVFYYSRTRVEIFIITNTPKVRLITSFWPGICIYRSIKGSPSVIKINTFHACFCTLIAHEPFSYWDIRVVVKLIYKVSQYWYGCIPFGNEKSLINQMKIWYTFWNVPNNKKENVYHTEKTKYKVCLVNAKTAGLLLFQQGDAA
jgi:hypothetical protein